MKKTPRKNALRKLKVDPAGGIRLPREYKAIARSSGTSYNHSTC